MSRSAVCTSPPHHWGVPRLGDVTTSLCHLHHLVGPYHHITTRAGASLSTFKKVLKTQLFREHLTSQLALRLVRNLQLQQLHLCTSLFLFYFILLYFLCKVVFIYCYTRFYCS